MSTPPPHRRIGPAAVAVLAAAQLYLLFFHLNGDAPIWQRFGRDARIARLAAGRERHIADLARAAGGHTVHLHFVYPPADVGNAAAVDYYGLNATLWPARAVVGDGQSIINDAATLRAADRDPVGPVLTIDLRPGRR